MGLAALGLQLVLPLFGIEPAETGTSDKTAVPPAGQSGRPGRRSITLGEQTVEYALVRSKRRSIGFQIDDRGLTVSAPRWASLTDIESALQEKSRWIKRKLVEWREHEGKRKKLAIEWKDGVRFPFLGGHVVLRVGLASDKVHGAAALSARQSTHVEQDPDSQIPHTLWLNLPPNASTDQLQNAAHAWCQQQARRVFAERLEHFAQLTGQRPTRWGLSSARTRWGSCAADGAIRLNWRLVHFPLDVIDYVVAHELSHIDQMNHSPEFWGTVGRLMPDFEKAKRTLAQYPDDW